MKKHKFIYIWLAIISIIVVSGIIFNIATPRVIQETIIDETFGATRLFVYQGGTSTDSFDQWDLVTATAEDTLGDIPIGTSGQVLKVGASGAEWGTDAGGTPFTHGLLNADIHTDVLTASVSRGSLVYGNSTPLWAEITIGASNSFIQTDGTDLFWDNLIVGVDDITLVQGNMIRGNGVGEAFALGASNSYLQSDGTDPVWEDLPLLDFNDFIGAMTMDENVTVASATYTFDWGETELLGIATISHFTDKRHYITKEYVDTAIEGIEFDYFFNDTRAGFGADAYYQMIDSDTGAGESSIATTSFSAGDDQFLAGFVTLSGEPPFVELVEGVYNTHVHAERVSGAREVRFYWTLSKIDTSENETILITSETSGPITDKAAFTIHGVLSTDTVIGATDRLLVKLFANVEVGGGTVDITLYQEGNLNSHLGVRTSTAVFSELFVRRDGTVAMTADWAMGEFDITGGEYLEFNNASISEEFWVDGLASISGNIVGYSELTVTSGANIDSGTLYVDAATNRVGIGTTSPDNLLHLYKSSAVAFLEIESNTDDAYIILNSNSGGGAVEESGILFQDNDADKWELFKALDNDFTIYDYTRNAIVFEIIDAGNMHLMANGGNVGIGTTNPSESFHVMGDIQLGDVSNGDGIVAYDSTPYHIFSLTRQDAINTADAVLTAYSGFGVAVNEITAPESGGDYAFYIENSGNIGIGDTDPGYKLSVDGTASISGKLTLDDFLDVAYGGLNLTTIGASELLYGSSADVYSALASGSEDYVLKMVNGVPAWAIDATGAATTHYLLGALHTNTLAASVSQGSIIVGNGTPAWAELTVGASNSFITTDGTDIVWDLFNSGIVNHDLTTGYVANEHLDWEAASQGTIHIDNYIENPFGAAIDVGEITLAQGVLIRGNTVGEALALGASNSFLQSDGTDPVWGDTLNASTVTVTILSDGTATLTGGVMSGLTSLTSTGIFGTNVSASNDFTVGSTYFRVDSDSIDNLVSASFSDGASFSANVYYDVVTVASASTTTIDWSDGIEQEVEIGGSVTIAFANGKNGGKYILKIIQSELGSDTVTWAEDTIEWSSGTAPTLTTTANCWDYFGFIYNTASPSYDAVGERTDFCP